jgi:hypothetical protein
LAIGTAALAWASQGMAAEAAPAPRPPAAKLLPDNTVLMVCVPSVPEAVERFMNTAGGKMGQDPQLKPLIGHLYGSLAEAVTSVQDRVGLSLAEMLAVPQGELAVALVAPKDADPALVVMLDAGKQIAAARTLLEKGTAEIEKNGGEKSEETIGNVKLTTYKFANAAQPPAVFFEKDGTIVAGNNAAVLKQVLAVWNGEKAETLADNFHYNAIMNRCCMDKETPAHALWFFDPIGLVKAIGRQNTGMQVAIAMFPALGVDGLTGIGGTVSLDAGQWDSVMHVHVLMNTPRTGVMKMIAMRSGDPTPERWVPADVASYMTLHWNLKSSFETLASLYDSFRGEGALSKAIGSRILGPTGVDFEKEILPALEGRATVISWIPKPAGEQGQTQMLALKLTDEEPVRKALKTVVEKFPERMKEKSYNGKTYYQMEIPARPPRRPRGGEGADAANPPPEPPPMPQPCFAVLDGYLMATNFPSLVEKIILNLGEGSKSLAGELDFKLVASKALRLAGDQQATMIAFNRPEEGMRMLYELAGAERTRQQLRRNAERNPMFKALEAALEANPLPPFAVLQKYLAPGGAVLVDDPTGLHYVTFSLRRKSE